MPSTRATSGAKCEGWAVAAVRDRRDWRQRPSEHGGLVNGSAAVDTIVDAEDGECDTLIVAIPSGLLDASAALPPMADHTNIDQQVELLHTYHLDLWTEIEAQLRVLRAAQDEIEKLRMARVRGEPVSVGLAAAQLLARHVHTLKGRVHALSTTVGELDTTVGRLVEMLAAAKD